MNKIDYKKIKELKNVGFPQEFKAGHWICEHNILDPLTQDQQPDNCAGDQLIYCPLLEEVIDELGGNINGIVWVFSTNDWFAFKGPVELLPENKGAHGETPLLSAINHYISINK